MRSSFLEVTSAFWLSAVVVLATLSCPGLLARGEVLLPAIEPLVPYSWEGVDLAPLQMEVMRRGLADNRDDAFQIARSNLCFILENKINRRNFLIEPSPRDLVRTVSTVLELNNEIADLIHSGRRLLLKRHEEQGIFPRESVRLLSEISDQAQRLQRVFEQNFVETKGGAVEVSTIRSDSVGTFSYYLLQVERLNITLTSQVNNYFLASSPGAVSIVEYSSSSITVLSEAIIRLGRLNQKFLR